MRHQAPVDRFGFARRLRLSEPIAQIALERTTLRTRLRHRSGLVALVGSFCVLLFQNAATVFKSFSAVYGFERKVFTPICAASAYLSVGGRRADSTLDDSRWEEKSRARLCSRPAKLIQRLQSLGSYPTYQPRKEQVNHMW